MTTTVHATSVAIGGRALLIFGASGSGKSDLALRLIDRGAQLISDDYTILTARNGRLHASAPATIRGRIEVRGVGVVEMDPLDSAPVALIVQTDVPPERLPEPEPRDLAGIEVPAIALAPFDASAPIKAELALKRFGLPLEESAS